MKFKQGFIYVLKNCWFWVWKFYLRPFDVKLDAIVQSSGKPEYPNELRTTESAKIACACISGAIWGAITGVCVWLLTGEIHAIWLLSGAMAFATSFTGVTVVGEETETVVSFVIIVYSFFINSSAVATFAFIFFFAFCCAFIGAFNTTKSINIVIIEVAISVSGILVNIYFPQYAIAIGYLIVLGLLALMGKSSWGLGILAALSLGLGTTTFEGFPSLSLLLATQSNFWGIAIAFSMTTGILIGSFSNKGVQESIQKKDLAPTIQRKTNWLFLSWVLLPVLSLVVLSLSPIVPSLYEFPVLVMYLAMAAPLTTGLPFYPLITLISLWECRKSRVKTHTQKRFLLNAPFRWQTFAYPLPGLTSYIVRLAREHGCETALKAIRELQFRSLQMRAGRMAILELARGKSGLSFCGRIAVDCNAKTLVFLAFTGNTARAVAALRSKKYKEDEQPLQLYVGKFPFKKSRLSWKSSPDPSWDEFIKMRERALSDRINYVFKQLDACNPAPHNAKAFRFILNKLAEYANTTDLENSISAIKPVEDIVLSDPETGWMSGGLSVILQVHSLIVKLKAYRDFRTLEARKEFLKLRAKFMQQINWDELPDYWASIGKELNDHWIHLVEKEAEQAKEWLKLKIFASQDRITIGRQKFLLKIQNPTETLAKNVRIRMEDVPGIFWNIRQAQTQFLEGGKDTTFRVELKTEKEGRYRLAGILEAEDMDSNPLKQPFVFSVDVSQRERRYSVPEFQPYQVGEGLGDDRTFAGRTTLMHELKSLWQQPGGKPAIVLVGQRRIGKTTLLNKIARDGLEDIRLIPVFVDIQGTATEYEFIRETARKMCETADAAMPEISRTEPFADFKDMLSGMKPALENRRFLLMLDEADLIPAKSLGERVPDFLRSLMQGAEYPVLLLFCGTHALSSMSSDYSSILFNTAHFRTVSYLTREESAEVLEKPAKGVIEFDPIVLEEAFRLTRGQPQLLQSLGMAMVNNFNAVIFSGESRSDFADLNDLNQAAERIVRDQPNSAFTEHWNRVDTATHRILSTMAWALDETTRTQLDINGLEERMREVRLELPRERTFKILEQLLEEEFLIGEGPTYRFAVPLYRRWIEWRWPPEKVREEGEP